MRVLLDTNVVLDHLLDRKPFSEQAASIFSAIEKGTATGILGATTVTTIHYLVAKTLGQAAAIDTIKQLLRLFEVAPINHLVLSSALDRSTKDFEDAVLMEAGFHAGANAIVTRDHQGFLKSPVPVFSPQDFLKLIE